MSQIEEIKKLKEALIIAADALELASHVNVSYVQVLPPEEWNIEEKDKGIGWCSTHSLVHKLREIAKEN